jgi:hypothetical protein
MFMTQWELAGQKETQRCCPPSSSRFLQPQSSRLLAYYFKSIVVPSILVYDKYCIFHIHASTYVRSPLRRSSPVFGSHPPDSQECRSFAVSTHTAKPPISNTRIWSFENRVGQPSGAISHSQIPRIAHTPAPYAKSKFPKLHHILPHPLHTKSNALTSKRRVSPGIEPGTTRNIDLEFLRNAVRQSSLSEYHTARPRDLLNWGTDRVGFAWRV